MFRLRYNLLRSCNRRLFHRLPRPFNASPSHEPRTPLSKKSALLLSAAALSSVIAYSAVSDPNRIYDSVEHAVHKSGTSLRRVIHHARQTGVAASVLWQSLSSVLSSANHEVRLGFELRVAALLADIASASAARREALVGAGDGAVVDWLLETVTVPVGAQDEAARALAYLIADPTVRREALGRPDAVPKLLKFVFSCQPKNKTVRFCGETSMFVDKSVRKKNLMQWLSLFSLVNS